MNRALEVNWASDLIFGETETKMRLEVNAVRTLKNSEEALGDSPFFSRCRVIEVYRSSYLAISDMKLPQLR